MYFEPNMVHLVSFLWSEEPRELFHLASDPPSQPSHKLGFPHRQPERHHPYYSIAELEP